MLLQLEDCTDILKAHHPGIDLISLFDNLCGNERRIEYRFNVTKMNSGCGGAQQQIHPTKIKQEVGYLCLYKIIIEVGNGQHMVFQEGSDVPFCMTPQERVAAKFIQYDEAQLKDKTKAELSVNIKSAGMDISVVKKNRLGKMQGISREKIISVTTRIRKERVKYGWVSQRDFCRYCGSEYLWIHTRVYITITHYVYDKIIMAAQLLR